MATAEQGTYAFIPPPPLPEFYLQKRKKKHDTSATSSSTIEIDATTVIAKEEPTMVDGAYDGRLRAATMPRTAAVPLMTMPPHTMHAHEVPPLAIYHICRVCLRPRSPRYHREHPIPINGLPPPPGICRRCRITTVEEIRKVADVVEIGESNKIKIGCITPFIPYEDIISNDEMRDIRMKKYLRTLEVERNSSPSEHPCRKDVIYRHVRVGDEYEGSPQSRTTRVTFRKGTTPEKEDEPVPVQRPTRPGKAVKTTELRKIDSTKASVSNKASSSSSSTSSTSSTRTPGKVAEVTAALPPQCKETEIHNIAKEEIERHRDAYWKSEQSDANIRRIAREEVEHYRQAERKLEAHSNPYAHGRMVPVERRIEQHRNVPDPMPWEPTIGEGKNVSISAKVPRKKTTVEVKAASTKSKSHSSKKQSSSSISSSSSNYKAYCEVKTSDVKKRVAKGLKGGSDRVDRALHVVEDEAWQDVRITTPNLRPSTTTVREAETATSIKPPAVVGQTQETKAPRYTVVYKSAREDGKAMSGRRESISNAPKQATKPSSAAKRDRGRTAEWPADNWAPGSVSLAATAEDEGRLIREKEHTPSVPSVSWKQRTWSRSSKPSERDSWYHESVVRTLDEPSSSYWDTSGSGGPSHTTQRQSTRETEAFRRTVGSQIKPEQGPVYTYKPSDRSLAPAKAPRAGELPYPEHDITPDGTVKPIDIVTQHPSQSKSRHRSRSLLGDGTEYLYAERIVQPAYRPLGRRPFDDHPPARHVEVEEIVETRRTPIKTRSDQHHGRDRSPSTRPRRERPDPVDAEVVEIWKSPSSKSGPQRSHRHRRRADSPMRYPDEQPPQLDHRTSYETKDHMISEQSYKRPPHVKPYEMQFSFTGSSKVDEKDPSWKHNKAELRGQARQPSREPSPNSRRQAPSSVKQDPRVQFSSKVHISPTPPGSDASSSEIRRFHRVERKKTAQVDGNLSPDRLEKHVEAYSESGRMRPLDSGSGYGQYEERESIHERGRSHRERSPGREVDTHERRRTRRLQRALSESPSREESLSAVRQVGIDSEKEELPSRAGKTHSGAAKDRTRSRKVEARAEKADGKGPYREEKITDSMRVEDGSPVSRVSADREERRWRDV